MLINAEEPVFTNVRAVRLCEKVMSVSAQMQEKPYIYEISWENGSGTEYF